MRLNQIESGELYGQAQTQVFSTVIEIEAVVEAVPL